jgi:hypothetical protein
MFRSPSSLALLVSTLSFSACGLQSPDSDAADDCFLCGKTDVAYSSPRPGSCAEAAVLDFVSEASLALLDDDVGLDRRAAEGIVAHGEFVSLEELDAVPYVGPVAMRRSEEHLDALDALSCRTIGLVEGEPNTGFLETFQELQDLATDECMPAGRSFFYDDDGVSDESVSLSLASLINPPKDSFVTVTTGLSRDDHLQPFLQSFGFDLDGLHTEIGFDDYHLARIFIESPHSSMEIMVLHYRESKDAWAIIKSCIAPLPS